MKVAQEPTHSLAFAEGAQERSYIEDIRALAQIAREYDLAEISVQQPGPDGVRLRVRRKLTEASAPVAAPRAAAPVVAAAPAVAPAAAPVDEKLVTIASPFVGTFYRASGPEAAPFVEVGGRVKKGQTLCIIEAMKLMNELEAEVDGEVVACLAENGRPVEYGEPLFRLRAG